MMKVSTIQYVLWVLPALLQFVLVCRMLVKKLYRDFPIFFAYTIFHIVQFAATLIASNVSTATYFYVFWTMDVIDNLLSIAIVQEVFSHAFRPYEALQTLGNALFKWAAIVLVLLCFVSALAVPGADPDRLQASFLVLQRSATILVGGLLVLLFVFCRIFNLRWRRIVLGVALGLGIACSVASAISAVRTHFGASTQLLYNLIQPLAYNIAVMVWVWSIYSKESAAIDSRAPEKQELLVWNQALQELLNR